MCEMPDLSRRISTDCLRPDVWRVSPRCAPSIGASTPNSTATTRRAFDCLRKRLPVQGFELLFDDLTQRLFLRFDIVHAVEHREPSSIRVLALKKTSGIAHVRAMPEHESDAVLPEQVEHNQVSLVELRIGRLHLPGEEERWCVPLYFLANGRICLENDLPKRLNNLGQRMSQGLHELVHLG